jgi:hypothetical protein
MTGIPAHLMCQTHRAWEAIFIAETCLKVLARGYRAIRELKLEGRFDLRLCKDRINEIRALDGGPDVQFPDMVAEIEKRHGKTYVEFLGYVHPSEHINHLRRVCASCRLLIDNDARTRGKLYGPVYVRRKK